jgi:pyruvate ferredoxin oxidoreductase gamma subunit
LDGLKPGAYVLVNTARTSEALGLADLDARVLTVPATEFAREHLGRPLPNAALLGAFAALTGVVSLDSVGAAIAERFPAELAERNSAAATAAHDHVVAHV